MSETINTKDPLMVKFDEEILKKVKEIVEKEAEAGELDNLLNYDYWGDVKVEVEVPVIFKNSGKEGNISREYFVEINIDIKNHG